MTAGFYDWTFEQGSTVTLTLIYKDSEGVVVNLTGYTARLQIRPFKRSDVLLLEATIANGRLVITPAEGKIVVTCPPLVSTALGNYPSAVYDLEIESSAGVVTRLLEGNVIHSQEVTR